MTDGTEETHESNGIRFDDAESFANLMLTLCIKEGFLLDRFLDGIKNQFIEKGGFRENLLKKRLEFKRNF